MCFNKICILFDLLQLIKVIVWRGIFCFNFSCLNILWFCNDFWCKNGFGYWSQIRPKYLKVVKKKLPKHKRKNHVFVIAPTLSFPFFLFVFLSPIASMSSSSRNAMVATIESTLVATIAKNSKLLGLVFSTSSQRRDGEDPLLLVISLLSLCVTHNNNNQTKKQRLQILAPSSKASTFSLNIFKFGINERFERFLLNLEIRYKGGSNPNLPFYCLFFVKISNLENNFDINPKLLDVFFFFWNSKFLLFF